MSFKRSALAFLILAPVVCMAQAKTDPQEEEAIRKVLSRWFESFEKRDADMRSALLTDDTIFLNAFGEKREGRPAVTEFWKWLFASGTFDQGKTTLTSQAIKFIQPTVAVADYVEEVVGQRGLETAKTLPPRTVHLTFVLVKSGNRWLVAYYRAGDLRDPATAR